MTPNSSQFHSDQALTGSLNELIDKLHLRIVLETPLDLTPSLLIAVLESVLESRLEIPATVRQSRDFPSKVQAMKIFLGVLETEVIRHDVGLSEVDPRKLAAGDRDEAVFVGELLVWLGKTTGILPCMSLEEPRPSRFDPGPSVHAYHRTQVRGPASPLSQSTTSNTAHSKLSMICSAPADSDTSFESARSEAAIPHQEEEDDRYIDTNVRHVSPAPSRASSTIPPRSRPRPRCIHEVEEPSFLYHDETTGVPSLVNDTSAAADSFFECPPSSSRSSPAPVRYTGYIRHVDDASEINSFEAARKSLRCGAYGLARTPLRTPSRPGYGIVTRHTSPTQHTLALLNERAKLLAELAALQSSSKT
ncbi:hypothetical protein WOLCODRAFT_97941 [Wolfiporia cocos MD-104 SS10]|uniref:DUF5745 domain-containing protein n=1 Tax=Wolfiporia cocos (strain MD-104) TaxID=742152 RepID=A0A2H3JCG2_WOLCO|nr:hypothetical protein WOLCODRAFT_97941 [Wolfiporia cocos MD-104 SS10]